MDKQDKQNDKSKQFKRDSGMWSYVYGDSIESSSQIEANVTVDWEAFLEILL